VLRAAGADSGETRQASKLWETLQSRGRASAPPAEPSYEDLLYYRLTPVPREARERWYREFVGRLPAELALTHTVVAAEGGDDPLSYAPSWAFSSDDGPAAYEPYSGEYHDGPDDALPG
jgi:hypothetical protein